MVPIDPVSTMSGGCQKRPLELAEAAIITVMIGTIGVVYKLWTKNREKQLKNERLRQQLVEKDRTISKLHQEKTELKAGYDDLKNRLSKTASEKMRKDNPIVESLDDPHRPTVLASKLASLFRCGEYWSAYENMKAISEEADIVSILHRVCRLTYGTTKVYVHDLLEELRARLADQDFSDDGPTAVSTSGPSTERQGIERFFPHKDEREKFLDSLRSLRAGHQQDDVRGDAKARELVAKLLKSKPPPASLIQEVDRVLQQEESLDLSLVKNFTDQLAQLIYYMRAQEIPLMLDFQGSEGTSVDPVLYNYERSAAAGTDARSLVIKHVLRPAVLRNEPGPVLSKGEVEVMSRSQWNSLRKKRVKTQDEVTVNETSTATTDPEKVTYTNEVHDLGTSNATLQVKEPPGDPAKSAEEEDATRHPQDQLAADHEPGPDQQGDDMPIKATSETSPAAQGEEGTKETTALSLQATTRHPEEGDPAGARDVDGNHGSASGTSDVESMRENLSASTDTSTLEPDVQTRITDNDGDAGSDSVNETTNELTDEAGKVGEGSGEPCSRETAEDSSGSLPFAGMDSAIRSSADVGQD